MHKVRKVKDAFAYHEKIGKIIKILEVHEKEKTIYKWDWSAFKKVPHSLKKEFLGVKYMVPGELGNILYSNFYEKQQYWLDGQMHFDILQDQMERIRLNIK